MIKQHTEEIFYVESLKLNIFHERKFVIITVENINAMGEARECAFTIKQMLNLEFFAAVDGMAQLWAADGQFLGILSSNKHNPYSINNIRGDYGSSDGIYSIRNSAGLYGNNSGIYSPYNTNAIHPPIFYYEGQAVLVVTKNLGLYKQVNGLILIDPDLLLAAYAKLANFESKFKSSEPITKGIFSKSRFSTVFS